MQPARSRLTYANVISTLCLFLLLGGAAWAAGSLPKNSVGAKQLKRHAVKPSKVSPQAITLFKGQKGDTGAAGEVRAFAYVHAGINPSLDPARTRGFAAVSRAQSGIFCLIPAAGIDPNASAPSVTAVWNSAVLDRATAQLETGLNKCGAGQIEVYTYTDTTSNAFPAPTDGIDFTVLLP